MTRATTAIVGAAMLAGFFLSLFGGDLIWSLLFAVGGAVFITANVRRGRV